MAIRRLFDALTARREKQPDSKRLRRGAVRRPASRLLRMEPFEERALFAVGPQLIAVIPNQGSTITNGETLNVAPTQLTFQFQSGESFNAGALSAANFTGIQISEAVPNGVSGTGAVTYGASTPLTPGAIVIGNTANDIVYRFANDLPDGLYTITLSGVGATGLTDSGGNAFTNSSGGNTLTETFVVDYGAQVTAVVPQPVSQTFTAGVGGALSQSNNEIDVYFSDDPLNVASAQNPANYELINVTSQVASGSASNAGETIVNPQSATYSYTAPTGSSPAVEEVKLMFAPGVLTPTSPGSPTPATQTELNWRLRIGDANPIPVAPTLFQVTAQPNNPSTNSYTWVGSSAATASNLGDISGSGANNTGLQTVIVTGIQNSSGGQPTPLSISNATDPVQDFLQYPGTTVTPGHREIPKTDEDYVPTGYGAGGQAVAIAYFNFESIIGSNNTGVPYYNYITPQQEADAEQILTMYGNYLGIQFVLTPNEGFTIATGDPRAIAPTLSPGAVAGIATLDSIGGGIAIVNEADNWGTSAPGGSWFLVAMHEIGHVLGLDHADNTPALTIMNGGTESGASVAGGYDGNTVGAASVFPGDIDIVNGQYILPPDVKDVNMFQFTLTQSGTVDLQTIAQRLSTPSALQSELRLFVADPNNPGQYDQIAQNEHYFGNDAYISVNLPAGTYYVGVSSVGNESYNPAIPDSGGGGNTQGDYELEIQFTPTETAGLTDAGGQLLDGNADLQPGGEYNFWFNTQPADTQQNTDILYVDKSAPQPVSGPLGSLTNPYTTISTAIAAAVPGDIVRIEGNEGADGKYTSGTAYEIGYDLAGNPLPDGATLQVPKGVTLMIDAGAILKLNGANISVGTVSQGVSHAGSSVQVLGTPQQQVYLTSFNNTSIGASDGYTHVAPKAGDWGGIVFYSDADHATAGVFDDYVDQATITYGGGQVTVNSQKSIYDPIDLISSQPTITFNTIYDSADAAMSADPNSFQDNAFGLQFTTQFITSTALLPAANLTSVTSEIFVGLVFSQDYSRVGPLLFGNTLNATAIQSGVVVNNTSQDNSINGMFIRIATVASGANAGASLTTLTVPARLTDTDIVYVLAENLLISGALGGATITTTTGQTVSNLAGSLVIDPGVIVKSDAARIETQPGTSALVAEGTASQPIIFTSLNDDTYGAGGSFQTNSHTSTAVAAAGDWGGLLYDPASFGSLDYVSVLYAGGSTTIEGGYDKFNALEIDQAKVRVADSLFEYNASGASGDTRNGRGPNGPATIYVLGAQPVLLNNIIENNAGAAISINVNALNSDLVDDWGRSTGFSYGYGLPGVSGTAIEPSTDTPTAYISNVGPLINGNELANNSINGLLVGGGVLTTQVVFDDTDIVYVVESEITVPDITVYGGLTIESSATASLVVKLLTVGTSPAGFTATGEPGDIDTRIGGSVDIVGTPSHPVILTSLNDNSVGAGYTPTGAPDVLTGNNASATPSPGDWRSIKLDEYSNDNNVAVVNGYQQNTTSNPQLNLTPSSAQYLGQLAPNLNSGDDNNRLGFQVDGTIAQPSNVDVYSFTATPGTQVFMTIDRTSFALGSVLELVDANGSVLAQVYAVFNPTTETYSLQYVGLAQPLQQGAFDLPDLYSINPRDVSMSVILPSEGLSAGQEGTYYVRVRSASSNLANLNGGLTTGDYDLQIKLADTYEWAGSQVTYADINYATNGVQILGQPNSSPLIGDSVSTGTNNTFATAEDLGNPLAQSQNQISVAGTLTGAAWYKFELNYDLVQLIGGTNNKLTWPEMFKVSYADGLAGPSTTLALYDSNGDLLFVGRNSNVADNEPPGETAADPNQLSHGSYGADPFIGSVQLDDETTYYLEVLPGNQLPATLDQTFVANSTNTLTRLEPIDSIARVAQDEIQGTVNGVTQTAAGNDQGSTATVPPTLSLTPTPYNLGNVVMYLSTTNNLAGGGGGGLYTVDPLTGALETNVGAIAGGSYIEDIAMRNDGELYGITSDQNTGATDATDNYTLISTANASTTLVGNLGIATEYIPTGSAAVSLANIGVTMNALAYIQDPTDTTRSLYAIGNINSSTTGLQGTFGSTSNLLYELNPTTGQVQEPGGFTISPPVLPSTPAPLGQVITGSTVTFSTGATVAPTDPTNPVASPASDVFDGQTVTINGHTFEFDSGPDVNLDPNGGNATRDGQTFTLNGKTFEFHSGPVVVINGSGSGSGAVSQYDTVDLTDAAGTLHVFQFVNAGVSTTVNGAIPVVFSPSQSAAAIATDLAEAINTAGTTLGATAVNNRVSLSTNGAAANSSKAVTVLPSNPGAITVQGSYTVPTGDISIPFQEYFSTDQMGAAIQNAVNGAKIGVTASYATGDARITFYGATLGASNIASKMQNLSSLPPVNTPFISLNDNVINGNPADTGVATAGDFPVPFNANDSPDQLATDLANAVVHAAIPGLSATANANQVSFQTSGKAASAVTLANGSTGLQLPFQSTGAGHGGTVTGMAFLGTTVQGVTGASVTTGGTGYTSAPTISFSGGGGTGATGTVVISGGAVKSITITSPGSGYTSAPTITFNNTLTGGSGAAAVASVSGGKGTMYAVSSQGDLFSVSLTGGLQLTGNGTTELYDTPPNLATYLSTYLNPTTGQNISFAGVTDGPPDVDNGAYANFLFATDTSGNVYALDPNGLEINVNSPASNITDGTTITVTGDSSATPVTFQLYSSASFAVTAGDVGINIKGDSAAQVAAAISSAIANAEVNLFVPLVSGTTIELAGFTAAAVAGGGANVTTSSAGYLADVFANGATSISTGVPIGAGTVVTGIAFSTLDYNLWHIAPARANTAGAAINPSPTDVLSRQPGSPAAPTANFSMYFGLQQNAGQPGAAAYASYASSVSTLTSPYNTYNLPGGAMGSLTSSTFSLAGYSTSDDPTLYFDYFLDDGNNTTLKGADDTFRVFISDDGANWTEVATNNDVFSTQTTTSELPQNLSVFGGTYAGEGGTNPITQANTANQQAQALWNNNSPNNTNTTATYRQARIDLGDFAGDSNLELRFDFTSYGSMGIGNVGIGGTMVSTPAGNQTVNTDSVTVGGQAFNLDVGYVLGVSQDGAQIADGTTFSITGPTGSATFQLSQSNTFTAGNVLVPISDTYTAQQVALAIMSAIENSGIGVTPYLDPTGTKIELGDVNTRATAASIISGTGLTLNSLPSGGSKLVQVDYTMSANTVAQDLANAINANPSTANDALMDGTSANDGSSMQIVGATVTATLPYSTTLPGDSFGDAANANGYNQNVLGNSSDAYEGVYLDDLIIGLAGRGEMVTGSTPLTAAQQISTTTDVYNLPASPLYTKQNYTGNYQLEMQRGSEYGANPPGATKPGINLGETFNINSRLTQGFSITAPSGAQLYDGESFWVTDGEHLVTFVFTTSTNQVNTATTVYIPFNASQSADTVASSIVSAVNNASILTGLTVEAGTIGLAGSIGDASSEPTAGAQVNFFNAVQVSAPIAITAQPGSSLINGQTFQLSDGGNGVTPLTKTFEFNSTGQPSAPGNVVIKYSPTDSAATVAGEIETAINNSGMIAQATLTLTVSAPAGSPSLDGTTFTVTDSQNNSVTFEFLITSTLTPGDFGIPITGSETSSQMAAKIVTAIAASGLSVTAINGGATAAGGTSGTVILQNVGGVSGLPVVDVGAVMVSGVSLTANTEPDTTQVTGQVPLFAQPAANINPGQTFQLSDGVNTVVFQYVTSAASVTLGDLPVVVSSLGSGSTITAAQVAVDLAAAINSAASAGQINMTAVAGTTSADANEVYLTTSSGTGGGGIYVPPSGAQISNTQTFVVTDGLGDTQTFEFDKSGTAPQAGNISIPFVGDETPTQIGALIASAINGNALGTLFFVSASQLADGDVAVSGGTIAGLTAVPAAAGVGGISVASAVASSPVITVYNLNPFSGFPLTGDSLNPGTQGYTIIYGDKITNSLGYGIQVGPGARVTGGTNDPVLSIALDSGGSGYVVAPAVNISAPPAGGTQATATATVNANGVVTGITITNPGSGYTSAPTVTLAGVGTGASAMAEITENSEPGPVRNLTVANSANLVPGISLENNLIVNSGQGGIQFSGDPGGGPSPFGRIVNNTIYGTTQASFTMTAPAGPQVKDGETFTVTDGQGHTTTFEFQIKAAAIVGDVIIPITGTESNQQIAVDIANAVNGVGLGTLNATAAANNGIVKLANCTNVSLVTTTLPAGSPSLDGQTLTLTSTAGPVVAFEFQIKAAAIAGDVIIKITGTETAAQIGADIIAALTATGAPMAASLGAGANTIQFLSATSAVGASFVPVSTAASGAGGNGIDVINNASPTILNNVLASNAVALNVDASSLPNGNGGGTVEGTNIFQNNTSNGLGGTGTDIVVPNTTAPGVSPVTSSIFVDAANNDFYLAQNITVNGVTEPNPAIDAGLNSLQDRPAIASVEQSVGMGLSPIVAPAYDINGVLRQNDPLTHPNGNGTTPYIDLGAIEHADFTDPTAQITVNNQTSASPTPIAVASNVTLTQFVFSLSDGTGVGIDPATVTASQFTLSYNGVVENGASTPNFYTFNYNATSNTVTLTAQAGIFQTGTYVISINNASPGGIADLAGNPLAPNNGTAGTTTFTINYGVSGTQSGTSWQNPTNKYDVNNDGVVNPLDVLILINALNSNTIIVNGSTAALGGGGALPTPAPATITFYYNVTGANPPSLTPADVLAVIDYLNTNPGVVAPAVSTDPAAADVSASPASVAPQAVPQVIGPVETVVPASPAVVAPQVAPAVAPSPTTPIGPVELAVTPPSSATGGASGSTSTPQQAAVVNTAPATTTAPASTAQQQAVSALMSSGGLWQQPLDNLDNVLSDIAADVQAAAPSTSNGRLPLGR